MAFFFGAVGVLRVTALWLNGHINNGITKPNGANVRAVCSALGALVMGQLTLALVVDAFTAEAPSFVIPVFGTLTIFEGDLVLRGPPRRGGSQVAARQGPRCAGACESSMEHLIALLPLLSSMPALQVFVGGVVAVTCVGMVLRANKDKHEVPPRRPARWVTPWCTCRGRPSI